MIKRGQTGKIDSYMSQIDKIKEKVANGSSLTDEERALYEEYLRNQGDKEEQKASKDTKITEWLYSD